MKNAIKAILRARTAADVETDIAALVSADAARAAKLAELQAARTAAVEAGDVDAAEGHELKLNRLRLEAEAASVRKAKLEAEAAALREAEAEAGRVARYDAARRASAERRKFIVETYPRLAQELAELLGKAEDLGRTIAEANADLPAGREPIASGEPHRGRPAKPEQIIPNVQKVRVHRKTGQTLLQYRLDDPDVVVEERAGSPTIISAEPAGPHQSILKEVHLPALEYGAPALRQRVVSEDEKLGAQLRNGMIGAAFVA
ncbi:hypothetical protein M446_1158 [Methylobacterium sp. 4-46]|uniref:hypothetical protein n=1 Tax=unclassified Methylobacterium TaxID=2615210 RepID=UPI000165C88A|nr:MULTISPECIES: hypothetical protein [Methylobacterium]ACA15684.1 hypothetical protein M446_1158 [Methylobacterium sp. 4-46]WFT81396.1 hypothetical protein QA634_05760 [Methylobacterium nodulans]